MIMIKNKTILILGAGQIGEACAIRVIREKPKRIILHSLTEAESKQTLINVKKFCTGNNIELFSSWGDALITKELMYSSKEKIHSDKKHQKALMDYYYSYLSDDLIKKSSLYYLVKKWKPSVIIDGINTATVVGYQDDPYSLPRNIIHKDKKQDWEESTENLLVSNIIPILIRFTQALRKAIVDFNVHCYVKISTTGLGGMGDNLFYTHGDVNEPGMSSGILGKVAAAGVIHQLFWSLSHTPGFNIKVMVPATLVGWQGINFGKFRSHGKNLPLVDSKELTALMRGNEFKPKKCQKISNYMKIPYIDSGENSAYSLGEMTAITTLGQMECITREEVAQATIEAIYGSTRNDLLTLMDRATLGPSYLAATQRMVILSKLKILENNKNIFSIATNNLGPTVSKHLFELFLMLKISKFSIKKCIDTNVLTLMREIEKLLLEDVSIRSQIVSLGLPILFEKNKIIIGEYFYVPDQKNDCTITKEKINLWATSGWVDVRKKEIEYWQTMLKKIYKEAKLLEKSDSVILDRNWHNLRSGDVGEILGFIYSALGGERKTEFC